MSVEARFKLLDEITRLNEEWAEQIRIREAASEKLEFIVTEIEGCRDDLTLLIAADLAQPQIKTVNMRFERMEESA